MQTVYLDGWQSHPITISAEGYALLQQIATAHRVCRRCREAYTTVNLMVVENLCLSCLVAKQSSLTYVGPFGEPDEQSYQRFKFLDEQGTVYLSSTRSDEEAKPNSYETLVHWGFPVPTVYTTPRGEPVKLYTNSWRIYGDIRSASVVVISKYYDQKHAVAFLSYKGSSFTELTRRDSALKQLLQRATAAIEATKDTDGFYHVGAYPTRSIPDSALYEVISAMESAVYDVQVRLARKKPTAAQSAEQQEVSA